MAEDKSLKIEETDKSKKKLIMIIAAVLLIIVVIAGYFYISGSGASVDNLDKETADTSLGESGSLAKIGNALYVAMPRPFIFNVPGSSRDRIVQIKVQLLVRDSINEEITKKHIPLIEGTLLSVFSTTTADELGTSAGKETLRFSALERVQAALMNVEGSKVIERVLFTGFVMQ
ncbi:flagellar basal body-associated protein FliL [Pseudoalteromonas distincta]|uniref:flagellar basal body-associated protein FliL n=1 Tax=Pseudoalteromonas distincta TaxID=77608 RepID=UPI0039ED81BE